MTEVHLNDRSTCPVANTRIDPDYKVKSKCPFHKTVHQGKGLEVDTYNHDIKTTIELVKDIGGGDRIRQMTTRFYAHAFEDQTLSKFMFETDCAAAHGQRLGDWIIEFMGGEGKPWSDSGRHGLRQYSHYRAWNSVRRDEKDRGTRFKLDDCRIWMRLMFWSAREVGLDKHEVFMHWYIKFIQRFIGIYEYSSSRYAQQDALWSLSEKNIEEYKNNNFLMKDVVGIGR